MRRFRGCGVDAGGYMDGENVIMMDGFGGTDMENGIT
jgi:hypothetical protein